MEFLLGFPLQDRFRRGVASSISSMTSQAMGTGQRLLTDDGMDMQGRYVGHIVRGLESCRV